MSLKTYSSFDEIDKDLRILKLQQKINVEQIKLDLNNFKSGLSPVAMVASTVGAIAKKAFLAKLVTKVFGLNKSKH